MVRYVVHNQEYELVTQNLGGVFLIPPGQPSEVFFVTEAVFNRDYTRREPQPGEYYKIDGNVVCVLNGYYAQNVLTGKKKTYDPRSFESPLTVAELATPFSYWVELNSGNVYCRLGATMKNRLNWNVKPFDPSDFLSNFRPAKLKEIPVRVGFTYILNGTAKVVTEANLDQIHYVNRGGLNVHRTSVLDFVEKTIGRPWG